MLKPKRRRKCKNPDCREWFIPNTSFETWCCIDCALVIARIKQEQKEKKQRALMKQKEKLDRAIMRVKKEKLKTRGQHLKECQIEFNKYIRTRDTGNVCISCSQPFTKKINAGHYLSVGSRPELRFNPLNAHSQCERCNSYLSGNAILYRKNLVEKIGIKNVEWLEGPHELQKWTIEEIKEIKQHFKEEYRRIENE
jgi:hypothetical protein